MDWDEPRPLTNLIPRRPYPIEALPLGLREAVIEVHEHTKAALPIVASSAIATLSVAAQAHWDVRRAAKLEGPTSIYYLIIADSGDRKSTCHNHFLRPILEYEAAQRAAAEAPLKIYQAAMNAWEAKYIGIKDGLRAAAKNLKDTKLLDQALERLEAAKPVRPRTPRLIYEEYTTEKLWWGLKNDWPSCGVMTDEGAMFFGSYSMGSDAIMRNLASLNKLWGGGEIKIDRKTTDSYVVRGARATISLQVQESALRDFLERSGALARGIGFLARCLVSQPESPKGTRLFTEPPTDWVHLDAFCSRIRGILGVPAPINSEGCLEPEVLTLSNEAKSRWIAFYDRIEKDQAVGQRLSDLGDFASKIAENSARLSGLFHVYCGSNSSIISEEHYVAASQIAEWHLIEALRFFGELSIPLALANAARLEAWLVNRCNLTGRSYVPTREVQQYGPYGLREKPIIEEAIKELEDLGRAKRRYLNKRRFIEVNPFLLPSTHPATAIPATGGIPLSSKISSSRDLEFESAEPEELAPVLD